MCGIGGIILRNNKKIDENHLNQIKIVSESQTERGPDSSKIYWEEDFVFSHNRLAIIDLSSSGDQPMSYKDWVIVFNGEIYNYKELKELLINENITFDGNSDTEVLLKLIVHKGIDESLRLINGIFAFCIFNKVSKDFYLVRDRMGEKPLFYYLDDENNLYFSSNPSSIVKSLRKKEWILDRECLWEFFSLGGFFTEKTLFKGISRLDSSCVIKGNQEKFELERYWLPSFKKDITNDDVISQIKKSIYSRTVSDVPIVLFLSGGVDSSAVAATLKNIQAVHLFSAEVEHANKIANLFNIELNVIKPSDFDVKEIVTKYVDFSGEPTMGGFVPFITSKSVSETHKVALSANGADELFFGYVRIPTPNINNEIFKKRQSVSKFHVDRTAGTPKEQKYHIFRHPDNFSVPILGVKKTESDLNTLLNNTIPVISSEFPESSKYRWFELMTYVKGDLNSTLDFSSMANSLEVRAPFLDHDLVEVALSVDENRHISKKYGRKHFLKTILENEGVPSTIWDREKLGFSLITSYKESIDELKSKAVDELTKLGFLNIHCDKFEKGRDREYLKTSAFGFYCWKQVWMDSGIVKL